MLSLLQRKYKEQRRMNIITPLETNKMKASIICFVIALAYAHGGVTSSSWMIVPGENGEPYIAILDNGVILKATRDIQPLTDITFHLYTRDNLNTPIQVFIDDLKNAPFDPLKPTKIIIHGFSSDAFTDWSIDLKNNFLLSTDCNVLSVDWSIPASGPLYNFARANSRPTGEYLAQMIQYLSEVGMNLSNVHCIGHSLGAHVCGFAGKTVSALGTLGRITGLDPASPLFDYDRPLERLADTDADYVDIIHTCSGWLGFANPIGHADFYPNGGGDQPGCGFDLTGACSHGRAHTFFAESILSHDFVSHECESWRKYENDLCLDNVQALMGNPADASTRGSYYLATSGESPFALGERKRQL